MKLSTQVLSIFLAIQSTSAFTTRSALPTTNNKVSLSSHGSTVATKPEIETSGNSLTEFKLITVTDVEPKSVADVAPKLKVADIDPRIYDPKYRVQTGRYDHLEMSIAVPFLKRPSKLDGAHAGDVGFDPLGFSESNDLYIMMEAEIRHARLAMLAAVGWPLSELYGPNWLLHGPNHVAPSVLNGFDPLSFLAVLTLFGGFSFFEYKTALRCVNDKKLGIKHAEDMANVWSYGVPGDYNFDPLNLYSMLGDTADGRKAMRELEIAHGRSAMLGISAFAAMEALTGKPIVANNLFFEPNAVLPMAAIAYLAFGFFFEVENNEQYLFQVRTTSEGEVRIEGMKKWASEKIPEAQESTVVAFDEAKKYAKIVVDTGKDIKIKYENIKDSYTKYSMRNICSN